MSRVAPDAADTQAPQGKKEVISEEQLWQQFELKPAFFERLELAEDGGFRELEPMFVVSRYFWAAVGIACLLMNLFCIIWFNLVILLSIPVSDWVSDVHTRPAHSEIAQQDASNGTSRWLIINSFIALFLDGDLRVNYEVMLAFLELGLFVVYMCQTAMVCRKICSRSGGERWLGVAVLLWDTVPELSTFSAMKTLNEVTPQVVAPVLATKVKRARQPTAGYGDYWELVKFVLLRILHLLVGFEAFMIKFSLASDEVNAGKNELPVLLTSLAFLNQLLGVVNVQQFSRRRLFIFIFGGEDGFLSKREEAVAATWLGMLAEKMWLHAKGRRGPQWAWFLAVGLSYGDSDFQMLVLNEEAKRKQKLKGKQSASLGAAA